MNDDKEPQVDIRLTNFPPDGRTGEVRQLWLGAGSGPMILLLEMDFDEESRRAIVNLTLSNAAENDEVPAFLADVVNLLETITAAPETATALIQAIEAEAA